MTESTALVRDIKICHSYAKDGEEAVRVALYILLMAVVHAIENGEPKELTGHSKITLVLQKSGWDSSLVFRLEAVEHDQALYKKRLKEGYYR